MSVLVVVAPSDSFRKDFAKMATKEIESKYGIDSLIFEGDTNELIERFKEWSERTGKIVGSGYRFFKTLEEALEYCFNLF